MSAITTSTRISAGGDLRAGGMPFISQLFMMTVRSLKVTFRTPAAVIPGLLISGFFLFVYEASLGNASGFLPGLAGKSYLAFILPVSIVSSALGGASLAGETIVRDIENGYFNKLLLTPVSRGVIVLSAMIAGAVMLVLQTLVVVAIGLLMGLQPETGVAGLLAVLGLALLVGVAFSGFTVGIALLTGSGAATQGASFLFFPLSFLTATFVPVELLSGWIKTAAVYNPITYLLEAMRGILLEGWQMDVLARGLSSIAGMAAVTFVFAFFSLRARTRRK